MAQPVATAQVADRHSGRPVAARARGPAPLPGAGAEAGVGHRWPEELSGESWEQGPVILSWDAATAPTDAHTNIVLHEFAHKLDMYSGAADGCPPLPPGLSRAEWAR